MNQKEIKKRAKLISSPGVLGILYDVLDLYYDYYGLPKPCKASLGMNVNLIASIVREKYKKQISPVVKKIKIKQLDIEESIAEVKEEKKKKGCQHLNIATDGCGDYCTKCGKRWSR